MPQRVANVSITLNRKEGRKTVQAGATENFTKDEIDQLTKLNPNALRKPINEELPEEANNDGSVNDENKIDTTSKDSDLTPAQKAAQTRAANKAAAADEENGGNSDEEAL